ncbi:hypothetical protein Tco_0948420 [Tanacetum coccineum]
MIILSFHIKMDSIIPLGQKNTLAEYMILSGADNRPPMLDKDLYDSWKSQMDLYMQNREHRRMILESVENGLLTDIYSLVNHHRVSKDLWERVQLLMQGETLHKSYLRFTQLINDMNIYNMKLEQFQVNTKLLNSLPPEWSKFVTDVKLVKDLHTTNFDQLHAYLEQHKLHANEVREGHMARQCTQPKRPRNATWYKEKAMLAKAQEVGQILDEEQLAFLADLGVPDGQAVQTIIPNNVAFQTEDLDTYDSDCDDILNAKAVLLAKISNYGSDVISEAPHCETYLNDMENQSVHAMQDFEQTPVVKF